MEGAVEHLFLEGAVFGVEQGAEDSGAGAEAPEDSALAQAGAFGEGVHRDAAGSPVGQHLPDGRQEQLAVAHGIGAFGAGRPRGMRDPFTCPTYRPHIKRGIVRLCRGEVPIPDLPPPALYHCP